MEKEESDHAFPRQSSTRPVEVSLLVKEKGDAKCAEKARGKAGGSSQKAVS